MSGYRVDPVRAAQARLDKKGTDGRPLKQAAAAKLLGIHPVTLNRIENGKARVSLELLERMVKLYGQTRAWLLREPETVDAVEASRERIANALCQIGIGFEELTAVLNAQLPSAKNEVAA